jgi:thioredoxin 1
METKTEKIREISESEFQSFINQEGITFVDVFSPNCGPCKLLDKDLEMLLDEFDSQFKVAKLNAYQNINLCVELGVTAAPKLFMYKNGNLINQNAGRSEETKHVIRKWISEHL